MLDEMLVKILYATNHVHNLREMFTIFRRYKIRLNPNKCAVGVKSGKFLGYTVSRRGIEANPGKIKALLDMKSPRWVKEVQNLTGRIVALTRFVSKATNKCQPFFKALKKTDGFEWIEDCEKAFQEMKAYFGSLPFISKPKERETLYILETLYKVQWSTYYVSKALLDVETRYIKIEKLSLALVMVAKKF